MEKTPYNPDEDENLFDNSMNAFCLILRQLVSRNKNLRSQLSDLSRKQKNGISASTKKEIYNHLLEDDICNDEWFQDGKCLLLKAKKEAKSKTKKRRK
ncbi:MAG: hypothetical protein G01um101413_372 [Parcubacteria group bacterium Gr01-1014_13]|nr:MAG: hypothetical protein G01um101413_372 [Parcubacteria group bacterium Gr01-1014_13]